MNVQVIMKAGEPEYAILPYADYQQLLEKARRYEAQVGQAPAGGIAASTEVPVTAEAIKGEAAIPGDKMARLVQQLQQQSESGATDSAAFSPEKVVLFRQQKNIDLAQLARSAGISPAYLKQIEAGEREPGFAIWRGLATGLGISLDELKA